MADATTVGLGNVLKALRIARNDSVAKVAKKVGVSSTYICDMESNRKKPSLDMLERYSSALEVSTSTLMYFNEQGRKHEYNHQKLLLEILNKIVDEE